MISVCCTVRNRTVVPSKYGNLHLFKDCVKSLESAFYLANIEWELVITDWKSTDTDYSWLPVNNKIVTIEDEGFSRGYGLNVAAINASYDNLFFTDTDMLVTADFLKRCLGCCNKNQAYFPICWSVAEPDRNKSKEYLGSTALPDKRWNGKINRSGWRTTGKGMCSMKKSLWTSSGKWPEYWKWGKEDGHFFRNISAKGHKVVRKNENGLVHCWHPTMRT